MPHEPNDVDRDRLRDVFVWAAFLLLTVIAIWTVFGDDIGPLLSPAAEPAQARTTGAGARE